MNMVVISLGSNIDPQKNVEAAIRLLSQKFTIMAQSEFVTTPAIGNTPQPDFLNGSVLIETDLDQNQLRAELKSIESLLGRKRTEDKFAPRTMDLDITVWNNEVIDEDFYTRNFIRTATLQILPHLQY